MTPSVQRKLKPNPFMTYRDPQTGKWMVIKPSLPPENRDANGLLWDGSWGSSSQQQIDSNLRYEQR